MNANGKNYLSTREAADWLGLSPRTLERYRVSGDGPVFHHFGGRVRYLRDDLEAWAQTRRRTSTSDDGGAAERRWP
ncbi:MAG: helix-turn-helix domain-containing protein [Nitrospinae bacterium]|nr:helix-turn-helix domain-containing protein [Nitrospinota bacterium]